MKDSGIEWIGEIPQGWSISKVKRFFETTLGKMLQPNPKNDNEELLDYLCSANITWDGIDLSSIKKMCFSPNEKEHYRLKTGDLLVTEGGDVAVSCLWNGEVDECYIQNAIHRVRSHEGSSNKFLYYLLYTLKHSGYIDLICNKATIAHFTKEKLGETPFIVCGFDEQVAISNFLDFKCAQIDEVIASKQKTNELLKERRQSIIYEAVTKGLDRNALMKDSGIEWIGMIPLEWGLEKLKFNAEINPRADIALKDEDDVSFVPMDNLKFGFHITTLVPYERVKKGYVSFYEGDILIAKVTPCFENGNLAIASNLRDGVGFGSTEITVIRAENIHVRYLYYYFQNPKFIERGTYDMYGVAGLKRLPTSFFANTCIPIPTLREQKTISDYLDDKCGGIDRLIRANNFTIEKLIEYRQSIIFEAVTGKMEVPRNCGGR